MGLEHSYDAIYRMISGASGIRRLSVCRFEWDISNQCESPVRFSLTGRPLQAFTRAVADLPASEQARFSPEVDRVDLQSRYWYGDRSHNFPLFVELIAACRRCEPCRRRRARLWAHKAMAEVERASRTWFATFTARPDEQYRWAGLASLARYEASAPFTAESEAIAFADVCAVASADITRYVKRVRKESAAPLRYLIVTERHKSGDPHFHAFVHEVDPAKPIRKAVLRAQWIHGFSRFKLLEPGEGRAAAWYLCKYLSKDLSSRVRASIRYGKEELPPKGVAVSQIRREGLMTPKSPEQR